MSLLSQLADELGMDPDTLRSAILSGGEDEALTPNYLTTNPDGTTGASFTGRVHAQGLDLDAGTNSTPPAVDRIRWIRQNDGGVAADLATYSQPPNSSSLFITSEVDATSYSKLTEQAQSGTPTGQSSLIAAESYVSGTGAFRKIIDHNGQSDFAQGPAFGNFQAFATTGLHSITGVGFRPRVVLFFWQRNTVSFGPSSNHLAWGVGMMKADGTAFSFMQAVPDSGTPAGLNGMDFNTSLPLLCKFFNNSGGWTAFFSSMDADGFTINVTAIASTDYRIAWMAF